MEVMTKAEFLRVSNTSATDTRSTKLKAIDKAIDDYHEAVANWDDDNEVVRTALKHLYDLIIEHQKKYTKQWYTTAFRRKRRSGLKLLRNQVENVAYHRVDAQSQARTDTQFWRDVDDTDVDTDEGHARILTENLKRLKLRVQSCTEGTVDLSDALHAAISEFFKTEGLRLRGQNNDLGRLWQNLVTAEGEGNNPTRCALVDLNTLIEQPEAWPFVQFDTDRVLTDDEKKAIWFKVSRPNDPVVGARLTQNQPAAQFPTDLRTNLLRYLRSLLTNELYDEAECARHILSLKSGYRCIVHFDYYASRATGQFALHKDTNGMNLFAVLHYLNADPIVGPEYIDDLAPIPPKTYTGDGSVAGYYDDDVYNQVGWGRMSAPWSKVADDKYVWPKVLLDSLQEARGTGRRLEYSPLPSNGLVSFVDELVFHSTPMLSMRPPTGTSDSELRSLAAGATIPSTLKQVDGRWKLPGSVDSREMAFGGTGAIPLFSTRDYGHRIRRRMSVNLSNEDTTLYGLPIPSAVSGGVRRFWRLWIAIAPTEWYKALPRPEDD